MRGATSVACSLMLIVLVSIHAPHAGRDPLFCRCRGSSSCFNPRAPCGARRCSGSGRRCWQGFNPRAPCGARHGQMGGAAHPRAVSIHAPHAGRDAAARLCSADGCVSIHAPHAGRDVQHLMARMFGDAFQSTRPMRGATSAVR